MLHRKRFTLVDQRHLIESGPPTAKTKHVRNPGYIKQKWQIYVAQLFGRITKYASGDPCNVFFLGGIWVGCLTKLGLCHPEYTLTAILQGAWLTRRLAAHRGLRATRYIRLLEQARATRASPGTRASLLKSIFFKRMGTRASLGTRASPE